LDREENLRKQKISSEQDYLDARNAFAEAKINMLSAEQKLRALGFKQAYLENLPNEPKEMLTSFEITAPFGGKVIQKHITLGELLKDDTDAFVVADLDTVWVDLQVHQKDIALVRKGQDVMISSRHMPVTAGVISYVEPVLNKKTRTALTRVVLDNSSGQLRPGTFVTAQVLIDDLDSKLVVDKDVIENIDDLDRVFVKTAHGFEARPVTIGRSNKNKVEIISGLDIGEKIVTKNSFRLKAELEKSAGGGHAGHGHAH
jgi:cobalt-zinc-cadmium efflux system membrane fusion protein